MPSRRILAAAQTVPIPGDVAANLDQHLRLVRAAAGERPQVLVFPELSLTGYEPGLAAGLACGPGDPRLAPLVDAARTHGTTLVVGAPVRLGARLHIGALLLLPDGSVDVYTKQHLGAFPPEVGRLAPDGRVPPAEGTVFAPGDRNPLVQLGAHSAAVAICADVGRPAHAEAAAARGAATYLASMFAIPGELERDRARLRDYAVRHSLAVVLANYGGRTGGLPAGGGSAIWSPQGEVIAALGPDGIGVVLAREEAQGFRGTTMVLDAR